MELLPIFEELGRDGAEDLPWVTLADRVGQLNEQSQQSVADYLARGRVLIATQSGRDPLDPARGSVVPQGWGTDGVWVWQLYWSYYVREYAVAVPEEFLEHARSRGFTVADVTDEEMDRIEDELYEQYAR